jgi:hypothetical protein
MKNIINKCILLFFALVVSSSFAQDIKGFTDKGNVLIAGTISFTDNFGDRYAFFPEEEGKIITIEANPKVLYFVDKNVALGGEFSIVHQYLEEFEVSGTELGLGPKAAYFTVLGSAYPFLTARIQYLNYTVADDVNDGLGLGFSTGILAPFTGNAAVLIEAGYRWEKIYYEPEALTGGTIFLGVGVGGMVSSTRREYARKFAR